VDGEDGPASTLRIVNDIRGNLQSTNQATAFVAPMARVRQLELIEDEVRPRRVDNEVVKLS